MCRNLRATLVIALTAMISGCCLMRKSGEHAGGWIQFNADTQRYSVEARKVPRGKLLDQLKELSGATVRPQPDPGGTVTAKAGDLDLESLMAILLPPGTRAVIRPGERDIAAIPPATDVRKDGPSAPPATGLIAKPDAAAGDEPKVVRTGTLKAAAESPLVARQLRGPDTKRPTAALLRTVETNEPKKPLPSRVERATVRLTLQFVEGAEPRLIAAQSIDGRAPAQRFVTGSYLFVVAAPDGRVLEAGTFQDPLIEHSYLPEGEHSARRATSGVVGFSIAQEHVSGTRIAIYDLSAQPMPRELNDETIRTAMAGARPTVQIDSEGIQRLLRQEKK